MRTTSNFLNNFTQRQPNGNETNTGFNNPTFSRIDTPENVSMANIADDNSPR